MPIYIFPSLDDEHEHLVTDLHSKRLIAAYQVLVDGGLFPYVVVTSLPQKLAKKLYPDVLPHLNVKLNKETEGIEIWPQPKTDE